MKKNIIIILMLLLLVSGCKKKETVKKIEDVKWETVADEKINSKAYKKYETDKFSTGYVKGIYTGVTYKYLYPSDIVLSKSDFFDTGYAGNGMQIYLLEEDIEADTDIDEYIDYVYQINKQENEKTTVKTKKISDDLFIVRISNMTFNDKATIYDEHLIIYLRDGEDAFIKIDYTLFKKTFDDELINKLVNGIKKESKDDKFTNCKNNTTKYVCVYDNIDSRTIEFSVDKKAFAMAANERPDYYYNSFSSTSVIGEDDYEARVGLLYLNSGYLSDSIDSKLIDYIKSENKVKIDGKEFVKYYQVEEVSEEERAEGIEDYTVAYYVYQIDDNTGIFINISSSKNTDDVLKYFTNINVKKA